MNFRLFQEHLKEDLTILDLKFLTKTFAYAASAFLSFGLLVLVLLGIDTWFNNNISKNQLFQFLSAVVSFISIIWFIFASRQYHQNPLGASKKYVKKVFTLLFLSYVFSFFLIFSALKGLSENSTFGQTAGIVCAVFFLSAVIYAIPAAAGLFLIKQKQYINLQKFISYCYAAYLVIFLIVVLSLVIGHTHTISSKGIIILFIIFSAMTLLTPMLTFYRMKMLMKSIDYTDEVGVYKWSIYFSFLIVYNLISISYHLVYFLFFFSRRI